MKRVVRDIRLLRQHLGHGGWKRERQFAFRLLLSFDHIEQSLVAGAEIAEDGSGTVANAGEDRRPRQVDVDDGRNRLGRTFEGFEVGIAVFEIEIAGSRAFKGAPPARANAGVVDRLLASGCRIVGKTNLHELAFGVTGINDWAGTPVNPKFPGIIPGGSSSGSAAAVAAGLADFAIGTDTGGSIRIPAACCGVFGLKPTFGRISRSGVVPAHSSLDCVGPIATDLDWLEKAMAMMDPGFAPETIERPTIGLLEVEADDIITEAVANAVAESGLRIKSVRLPLMNEAFAAGLSMINAENWTAFGHLVGNGVLGADIENRLAASKKVTASDAYVAENVRRKFRARVDKLFGEVDVLALPTLPGLPPSLEEARSDRTAINLTSLVRPFNLSGHPAGTIPLPPVNGRPVALQVVGAYGCDSGVLNLMKQLARTPAQQKINGS
ncbi:amidase (plasmid) [Rhizobium leguminosarum bv. viciae]|nr:amidase [Rhizobium leguminosarum bv. viciae]